MNKKLVGIIGTAAIAVVGGILGAKFYKKNEEEYVEPIEDEVSEDIVEEPVEEK